LSSSSFLNQLAVVTGASGAIGHAIAARLHSAGASLCLAGRSLDHLEQASATLRASPDRLELYPVDLETDDGIADLCSRLQRQARKVDLLVHAAGVWSMDLIRDARVSDLDRQYRVNVRAPYLLTQALLPGLIARQGQVVFINSSAGLGGRKGLAQYSATKHALRGMADSLREEVNASGVRVLSVFLGRTASRMQAAVHEREGRAYNPGVLLQPDDVAAVVVSALELPRTAEVTDISVRPFQKSY
jgi:NADP-dependent 3-hydroxy acid dehydrogenase YdfG